MWALEVSKPMVGEANVLDGHQRRHLIQDQEKWEMPMERRSYKL